MQRAKSSPAVAEREQILAETGHAVQQELLEQTDIPISEIAERTGFGNSNYFYTVFKRQYSITPTEYRANRPNLNDTRS